MSKTSSAMRRPPENASFHFQKATKDVGGWLTENEGQSLYNAAKAVQSGHVVIEIGSWKGKSTICLAQGAKDGNGGRVVAIDPHIGSSEHQKQFGKVDTFEDFLKNIERAGVNEHIQPIRSTSEHAAKTINEPIEFVFIDGAHELRCVAQDYRLWFPKVMNHGWLAFHDSWHFPGPNILTAAVLLFSSRVRNPRLVDTITYFQKVERNSLLNRVQNISFVIYRLLFGVRGFLRLKDKGSPSI